MIINLGIPSKCFILKSSLSDRDMSASKIDSFFSQDFRRKVLEFYFEEI